MCKKKVVLQFCFFDSMVMAGDEECDEREKEGEESDDVKGEGRMS